jgi:GntR family carbon starvation induced transcriptional regulator
MTGLSKTYDLGVGIVPSGVPRETLTELVETALRRDILQGVFLPSTRIRGTEAKARYGVSATPFREALQRLASEGFVEIDAQSGARVAAVSRDDLRDIFALRLLLEREALRRSIENTDDEPAWSAALSVSFNRYCESASSLRIGAPDLELIEAWSDAHDRFYEALYSSCGSERLKKLIWGLLRHAQRYHAIAIHRLQTQKFDLQQIDDLLSQVEAIYRAALNRETDQAVAALEDHLTKGEAYVAKILAALERSGLNQPS